MTGPDSRKFPAGPADAPFATRYEGPTHLATLTFSGTTIRLLRPADPDRLLNDPDVLDRNRRDDYMPYWAYLWPGAYLLAEAVAREPWTPGAEALEIGCGLGLAGLVGLAAGLRVHFTDYDEAPLQFVRESAEANGFGPERFTTRRLDWRSLPDEQYPVILGADVLYERPLVPLVSNLIHRMLAPDGVALVAGPYRVATEGLDDCLARLGLVSESTPIAARTETGQSVRGTLHKIRHANC
jgi:predicted nicotinamide N-methyase